MIEFSAARPQDIGPAIFIRGIGLNKSDLDALADGKVLMVRVIDLVSVYLMAAETDEKLLETCKDFSPKALERFVVNSEENAEDSPQRAQSIAEAKTEHKPE